MTRNHDGQQPSEYETVVGEVAEGHLAFVEGGHFFHLEVPELATATIRSFLARSDLVS